MGLLEEGLNHQGHIFMTGDQRIFLGIQKMPGYFGVMKKQWEFFWVLYLSSAQINNNISAIYCLCGIFLGTLKSRNFFGYTNSEVGIFWGIKYEPLDPPSHPPLPPPSCGAPGA